MRPALASEWTADSAGRRWIFTLSQPAQPPERSRITAADVVSSWQDRRGVVSALGIDSAVALGDGKLSVTLRATFDSAPRLFADPALAVPATVESLAGSTL
ncbi:MAG TPA: hypothetical protein VFU40_11215, partial [Gemmatimonadales bacterium]|nr:hypothetical protein [Gemmatimonadales bacterium]